MKGQEPKPRHLFETILSEKYNLDDEELTEAVRRAVSLHSTTDVYGNPRDGTEEIRRTEKNKLSDLGIEWEELRDTAKEARQTGEFDFGGGSSPVEPGVSMSETGKNGSYSGLIAEIQSHDLEPEDLLVVADPDGKVKSLLTELEQADVSPGDVAVGRRSDLRATKKARESLIEDLSESKGIDSEELENLSLSSLSSLSDGHEPGSTPVPDPKSEDIQRDERVPKGEQSTLNDLREIREFLESKDGALAESRLETVNQKIRELRGK